MWWPALGGFVVGLGGLIDPRVLGIGYETIHQLIRGDLLGASLVTLVVVKAIVWSVALGSGTSGGVLAPLLMIGGAIGALFGIGVGAGHPGLWAMIGMAGMMGGTMRSPFTGMVFVLELTHDLNALPALMIGSLAALCVTVLLLRRSILTEKLARRGQHIAREYSVDVFELARVADVMDRNIPLVPASLTVAAFSDRIAQGDPALSGRQGTILVDAAGRLAGVITRGDILPALQAGTAATTTLRDVASTDVVVAYPDETLRHAIGKMLNRGVGRLPVVERSDSGRVIGYLGRADILAVHVRLHEEEELLERGPLLSPASPRQIDHVAVLPPRSHASHFARSGSPLASQLRQMLSLVRPKEHGSWSLALEPLVLGLIAVPSLAGIALGAAVLAGFFLRRPFKVVTCDGDPRRIHAWVCVASLGALTAAGVTLAAVLATPTGLWPLLLAVPPGLAFAWFESRGEARAAAAELAGAVAFSVVPAALATAAGWRTLPALALAAIMAGREVPTVMTIRAYLRRRKGKAGSTLAPLLAALIALIGAGALVHERLAPLTAVLFLALLFVRTVALLGPYHLRLGATRLGVAEAIVGGTGVTLLALDWPH
jgi:CBS domain-containing protein